MDGRRCSGTYVSGIHSLAVPIHHSTQVPMTWKSSYEIENEKATHDHVQNRWQLQLMWLFLQTFAEGYVSHMLSMCLHTELSPLLRARAHRLAGCQASSSQAGKHEGKETTFSRRSSIPLTPAKMMGLCKMSALRVELEGTECFKSINRANSLHQVSPLHAFTFQWSTMHLLCFRWHFFTIIFMMRHSNQILELFWVCVCMELPLSDL